MYIVSSIMRYYGSKGMAVWVGLLLCKGCLPKSSVALASCLWACALYEPFSDGLVLVVIVVVSGIY